jgi:DNA primase
MSHHTSLLDVAFQYHDALPNRIRAYLNGRGIPDEIIDSHLLGWNGWRITIPIYNRDGEVVSFRLAKDPVDPRPSPKMLSSPGSTVELYGWDKVLKLPQQIIVCEGEFDRLVLQAQGFATVTSTGGAATFRPQWADELKQIPEVYLCFDRDNAGGNGAAVAALMIPQAKVVEWPPEVGEGGDVTDFFVRLNRTRNDFLELLEKAKPAQVAPATTPQLSLGPQDRTQPSSWHAQYIQILKRDVPIDQVVGQYVRLRASGKNLIGKCPFHQDRNPSFAIYPATGTFHCFGCRAHGDVINFLQKVEHLSFAQAVDVLEQLRGGDGSTDQQGSTNGKAA